jgi:hypothetical protein
MENATIKSPRMSASDKAASGALLTLTETAAWLSVAPSTVHRLPLPSIRLGKSLRFDPTDVRRLIEASKEPAL